MEVAAWLDALGLATYAARFAAQGYDAADVCSVRAERGREMEADLDQQSDNTSSAPT